jgi:2-aminoadipate transaminase
MTKSWTFADRTQYMGASIIREILKVSSRPGVTSFAGGLPAPTSFPLKEFKKALNETMKHDATRALQYMVTEGHYGLKSYLCEWLKGQNIHEKPERMLLTQGSQQALDFLGKIFF